jgi:formiminotetrahydrofolate cyclodeaminase
MQAALKAAAAVPLAVVSACHRLLQIAAQLVDRGNPNLITDVGVAAKFALAGMECAALNVEINLVYIRDKDFVDSRVNQMKPLLIEGEKLGREVWTRVIQKVKEGH